MNDYPNKILNTNELDELMSTPSKELVELMKQLEGDILFLGVAGKMGPTLARMTLRATSESGRKRRIIGVSLFGNPDEENKRMKLEESGIETIKGDLLERKFLDELPKVENVIFMAGMKFGSEGNLPLCWAMNTYVPALVTEYFRTSRIVVFSTGTVYPLVAVSSGGSLETDASGALGEYAQSCLGRERMFEYGSKRYGNPIINVRLNYSVEMRYGVIVDIALKVKNDKPVDLKMGYFNVIWQGDASNLILQCFSQCTSPANVINITGPEILSVRKVAEEFGKIFNKKPKFVGKEADTALLSNAQKAFSLFGKPKVTVSKVIEWTADWILNERELLNKPTKFEIRDGKY
ncbi:NAD-dependent epimerase/dehydratase family protein [Bacteroidota bacterium]